MSNIPKTVKFTLKQIVENLDAIPKNGFGTEVKSLTPEQKQKLVELSSMYETFGECLQNEEAIINSAKNLTELSELAELYALNDCGDAFQRNIMEKDMKEVKKRVMEYNKVAKECYARMQQLGVSYQDIGHVLGRYYDLKKTKGMDQKYAEPSPGNQPMQNEDIERVCSWCKKPLPSSPGDTGGKVSHGICDRCKEKFMGEIPSSIEKHETGASDRLKLK